MRLAFALVLVGVAALAARVEPAAACSCAPLDARSALAETDAAFVGVLLSKRPRSEPVRSSADPALFTFQVERVVKGDLGDTVVVQTAVSGASCGLELEVGQRIGLFLERRNGVWTSGLCWQVAPERLLEATAPLPPPDGSGAPALVVGGRFGPARTIVLDSRARTLAYGGGQGRVVDLASCPGGRAVAEVVAGRDAFFVALRDVRSARLRWERRLRPSARRFWPRALTCRGSEAVVLLTTSGVEAAPQSRLLSVRRGRVRTLHSGTASECGFGTRRAFLTAGSRLVSVPLEGGSPRLVARVPRGAGPFVPSPDGRRLAGIGSPRLVLVDGSSRRVRTVPIGANVFGKVAWLDRERLAFLPGGGDAADARVYDTSLRLLGRFSGWWAPDAAVVGARAYGVRRDELISAALPNGPVALVRTLPGPLSFALTRVPRVGATGSGRGSRTAWILLPAAAGALGAGGLVFRRRRR